MIDPAQGKLSLFKKGTVLPCHLEIGLDQLPRGDSAEAHDQLRGNDFDLLTQMLHADAHFL